MKKHLTFISAVLTAAVILSGCGGTADDMTAEETAAVTEETESKTETASFSEVTETETVTEITAEVSAETSETAVGTGGVTAEGLVVSPSGYVLDPRNVLPEGTSFWYDTSEEVRKSGLAYLLTELPDGETRIYGTCIAEAPDKIIIEHDGVGDEFEEIWWTRYGDPLPDEPSNSGFTLLDIDGDGENEIILKVYASSGTFHCVYELVVYKMEEGHYKRYLFESEKFADEYIKTDIDSGAETVTVSTKDADNNFVYDSSETCPEGVKSVFYHGLIVYDVSEDGVKVSYYGLIGPDPENGSIMPIDDYIRVNFKVTFKDGEFVLSDPEIAATDYFDSYNDW